MIIGESGSGRTYSSFTSPNYQITNSQSHQIDIDRICFYAKDLHKAKYHLLMNKRKSTGLKHLNDSKAFIECSSNMDDIHKNIVEHNSNKKSKILLVVDEMVANMFSNKRLKGTLMQI